MYFCLLVQQTFSIPLFDFLCLYLSVYVLLQQTFFELSLSLSLSIFIALSLCLSTYQSNELSLSFFLRISLSFLLSFSVSLFHSVYFISLSILRSSSDCFFLQYTVNLYTIASIVTPSLPLLYRYFISSLSVTHTDIPT